MLAGCLTYLVHRQRDRVGFIAFDSDVVEFVPPSAKHMDVVLHVLDRLTPSSAGSLRAPLHKIAEHFGRRGLLVLISDLYEEPDAVLEAIGPLRFRGNDLAVFHLLDPAELDFSFRDPSAFEDLESGEQIPIVPDALADQYKALVQAHVDALSDRFAANRIDYTLVEHLDAARSRVVQLPLDARASVQGPLGRCPSSRHSFSSASPVSRFR